MEPPDGEREIRVGALGHCCGCSEFLWRESLRDIYSEAI